MKSNKVKAIALEGRLRHCRNVETLGVKPNFDSYDAGVQTRIKAADKIYYPSVFYADLFDAMGKTTFPSYHNYKCVQDKIKQTALLKLLELPHPQTRVFYGRRQQQRIGDYFTYPYIAKVARGSAMGRGVYLIENDNDMEAYLDENQVAYIQQYLPVDRDMRLVVIGRQVVHAYWRIAPEGEFRTNVAVGGRVDLSPVPEAAVALAMETARRCKWDDVGIDICMCDGQLYVLEANMKYGKEGFRQAGIDYVRLMEGLIDKGMI